VKAAPLLHLRDHVLLLLALWGCRRRASVVQAERQIHRAHLARPRRHRAPVTQGPLRPALVIEAGLETFAYAFSWTSSCATAARRNVVQPGARPFMLIRTPAVSSLSVDAALVNCAPGRCENLLYDADPGFRTSGIVGA
jgi:hypothetical protein